MEKNHCRYKNRVHFYKKLEQFYNFRRYFYKNAVCFYKIEADFYNARSGGTQHPEIYHNF